ncbi:MAG: segregation/condensation protein A, partial [Candidatus Nanopelagicales bacterium]
VSAIFAERMAAAGRQVPRTVGLDRHFADLLPEVVLGLGPDAFAALAAKALAPRLEPEVSISHLHVPLVSVREQAAVIVGRLRRLRTTTFRSLVSDAATTMVVIGRFLALLELFREGSVSFEQLAPLGDLTIRWTGSDDGDVDVRDEYDDHDDEASMDVELSDARDTDEGDGVAPIMEDEE